MARKTKSEVEATAPEIEGIATEGASELPHNHRLRAEKLVEMGETEDPDGLISADLIANTKDRLEREANAPEPEILELDKIATDGDVESEKEA